MNWIAAEVSGRRARLMHANRRGQRIARMSDYVASMGASPDTLQRFRDASDELIMNAFYDAPVAAGAVDKPIPRTQDVSLPAETACDLAYGRHGDLTFVHVRDPFGSLSRTILVEALSRPDRADAAAGSGLGLRGVVRRASLVAISVVNNHYTEVLVGFLDGVSTSSPPFALHLFVKGSARRRLWKSANQDIGADTPLTNTFVSFVITDDGLE